MSTYVMDYTFSHILYHKFFKKSIFHKILFNKKDENVHFIRRQIAFLYKNYTNEKIGGKIWIEEHYPILVGLSLWY